jgi:hypothetical protein
MHHGARMVRLTRLPPSKAPFVSIGTIPFRVDLFGLVLNPAHSKIAVRLGKGSARVDVARFGIQFIVYIQRPGFVPHLLRSGMK